MLMNFIDETILIDVNNNDINIEDYLIEKYYDTIRELSYHKLYDYEEDF